MGKYDSLSRFLEGVQDDQRQIELSFGRVDGLVGGLPPSARRLRTWWANNSQAQSLAWNRCGWHVQSVDLAGGSVVFARGRVGGTYAARGRAAASAFPAAAPSLRPEGFQVSSTPALPSISEPVDARVVFEWRRLGAGMLDPAGKISFPGPLPTGPGLYRFTLARPLARTRIYIGESDNLRRRLNTNYRNPGPRQRTSLRINALLVEQLRAGTEVFVDISVSAEVSVAGAPSVSLDLGRKAGRLLAESAALVLAQKKDDADIENLG